MNGRSLTILGLAAVCGLIAMYGAGQLLNKKPKPVETRNVLIAARDLKVEEVLKADMVKVVQRPVNDVPAGAFASADQVEGRWIQIPTLTDEPILAAKLAAKDLPPGLTSRIPKGKRAFAVEVNEQSGVSGFIMPDHRVDVLQDPGDNGNRPDGPKAQTILHNMQVLAVGQVFTRPEDKSMLVRTVTLAVTPDEAETLTAARASGGLTLALRGLHDAQGDETTPKPVKKAEPVKESVPVVAAAPPPTPTPVVVAQAPRPLHRNVHIIHGVQRTKVLKVPLDQRQPVAVAADVQVPAPRPEQRADTQATGQGGRSASAVAPTLVGEPPVPPTVGGSLTAG